MNFKMDSLIVKVLFGLNIIARTAFSVCLQNLREHDVRCFPPKGFLSTQFIHTISSVSSEKKPTFFYIISVLKGLVFLLREYFSEHKINVFIDKISFLQEEDAEV